MVSKLIWDKESSHFNTSQKELWIKWKVGYLILFVLIHLLTYVLHPILAYAQRLRLRAYNNNTRITSETRHRDELWIKWKVGYLILFVLIHLLTYVLLPFLAYVQRLIFFQNLFFFKGISEELESPLKLISHAYIGSC